MSLHEAWDSHLLASYKVSLPTTADSSWFGISGALLSKLRSDPARRKAMELTSVTVPSSLVTAVSMASETATTITCQWAYRNSFSDWIKSGDSLDDEYVHSRGEIMLEQFEKAGVRLAQLLEAVASAYHAAERAAQPSPGAAGGAGAGSGSAAIASPNYFASLELPFEFDPEDYLLMMDDEDSVSDDTVVDGSASVSSYAVDELMTTTTTTVEPGTTMTLSKEEKRQAENRKKRLRKKRVDGVDLDALVLIKRRGTFFITYRKLVTSDTYMPMRTLLLSAKFATGTTTTSEIIHFYLDVTAFGDAAPSMRLIQLMFYKLKGIVAPDLPPAAAESVAPVETEVNIGIMPVPLSIHLIRFMFPPGLKVRPPFASFFERAPELIKENYAPESTVADLLAAPATPRVDVFGRKVSLEEDVNRIFFQQMDQLVTMLVGKIQLLSRYDLLVDTSNRRWVFNMIPCSTPSNPTDNYWVFVDARMFDEGFTDEIIRRLDQVSAGVRNRANGIKLLRSPLPIIEALDELSRATFHSAAMTTVSLDLALRVERYTPIIRHAAKGCLRTVEVILRAPADARRLATLMGVPPPVTVARFGAKPPQTWTEREAERAAQMNRK